MFGFSWLGWLRSLGRRKSQPARKRPPHYRLCLETLETRLAPASFIWTGNAGAGNTNWSAGANWFGGVAPTGANDDLIFPTLGGAGPFTTNNNLNNALVKSIRFQGNNYTVTGNALTLGTSAGGVALISESGAFGNTINLGVTLAAGNGSSEVFQIAAGTTVLFGGSSSISGVAGATLDKRDLGVLALNGNNSSLNSLINVGQGILGVANPNALGATSAGTTVQPNAQLQISNNVTVNEPLLLNGPGIINDGALLNASGANTWAGTITLDSDAILGSATGGSLNISGLIQDNGAGHNITKEGGGQLIFSHVGGNTYRGLTTINNGILTIQDPLSLGAQGLGGPSGNGYYTITGITRAGTTATVTTSSIIANLSAGQIVTISGIASNGYNGPVKVTGVSGTTFTFTVPNTLASNAILDFNPSVIVGTSSGTIVNYTPAQNKTGTLQIQNVDSSRTGFTVLDELVTLNGPGSSGALSNVGSGVTANATITSAIESGTTVTITTSSPIVGLAAGQTVTISGVTTAGYNGAVTVTGVSGNTFTYTAAAGLTSPAVLGINASVAYTVQSDNQWAGSIVLGSPSPNGSAVNIGAAANTTLTVSGVINNPNDAGGFNYTLSKVGTGRLVLNNSNLYTSATTISAGVLNIRDSQGLGPAGSSSTTTTGNSTLELEVDRGLDPHGRDLARDSIVGYLQTSSDGNQYQQGLTVNEQLNITAQGFNNTGALHSISGVNQWTSSSITPSSNGWINVDADPSPSNTALYFARDYSLTITGDNHISLDFTKLGAGHLILPGTNNNVGNVTINQGWITAQDNGSLGSGISTVTVTNGGALHLKQKTATSPDFAIVKNLVLNGTGITHPFPLINQKGALMSLGGNTTLGGPDVFNASTTLTLNGQAGIGVELLDPSITSQMTIISRTVDGASPGGITKLGSRILILAEEGEYTGPVNVNEGVIRVQNNTALGMRSSPAGSSGQSYVPNTTTALGSGIQDVQSFTAVDTTSNNTGTFVLSFTGKDATGAVVTKTTNTLNAGDTALNVQNELNALANIGPVGGAVAVTQSGAAEVQNLTINNTGGTFTLQFGAAVTGAISGGATPGQVAAALNALSTIGGVGGYVIVSKSGNVYTITFAGALGMFRRQPIIATGTAITAGNSITSATESGTTVTITTSGAISGLAPGSTVTISGITTPGYNGTVTVTSVTGNKFTYTAAAGLTSPATLSGATATLNAAALVEVAQGNATYVISFGGSLQGFSQQLIKVNGSGSTINGVANVPLPGTGILAQKLMNGDGSALELDTVPALQSAGGQNVLGLSGGLNIWNENLVLRGTGNNLYGDAALTVRANDNFWQGPVTLANSTVIHLEPSSRLIFQSTIDDATNASPSGSDLTINGGGELTLAGANTYRGITNVTQGLLAIQNSQALGVGGSAEVQTVTLSGSTGGTFRLKYGANPLDETPDLAATATGQQVQDALNALPGVVAAGGVFSVTKAGAVFSISFGGNYFGFNQAPLTVSNTAGGTNALLGTLVDGGGGTIVSDGAALQLQGSLTVVGEPLILQGQGNTQVNNVPQGWFSVGPSPINSYPGAGNLSATGRVTGVAVDPNNTNIMYLATAGGGVWKTVNGGKTWDPLFDLQKGNSEVQSFTVSGSGTFKVSVDTSFAILTATATDNGAGGYTVSVNTDGAIPGLAAGQSVTISGISSAGYNGTYVVTSVSGSNLTYTVSGAVPVSPAVLSPNAIVTPASPPFTTNLAFDNSSVAGASTTSALQLQSAINNLSSVGGVDGSVVVTKQDTNPVASYTITSASEAGTTVTITTAAAIPGLAAGQKVAISGLAVNGYNGIFTVTGVTGNTFTYSAGSSGLANDSGGLVTTGIFQITSATRAAGGGGFNVTIQTPSAITGLAVGQKVTISGLNNANYNGTFTVTNVAGTSFQYFLASDPGASGPLGALALVNAAASTYTLTYTGSLVGVDIAPLVAQASGNAAVSTVTTVADGVDATAVMYIGTITMDPSNSATLYIGTGETNSSPGNSVYGTDSFYGTGVYKTTDAGKNWTLVTDNTAAQALTHDYELNGNLTDSVTPPGSPLSSGGGSLATTSGYYTFAAGQGLSLSNSISATNYSIEMKFQLTNVTGYKKILDFKNLTADAGLYVNNGALEFKTVAGATGTANSVAVNTDVDVFITRSATGTVTVYLNGVQQFSFNDGGNAATFTGAGSIINFFMDDTTTNTETAVGAVDKIRIFNTDLNSSEVQDLSNGGTGAFNPFFGKGISRILVDGSTLYVASGDGGGQKNEQQRLSFNGFGFNPPTFTLTFTGPNAAGVIVSWTTDPITYDPFSVNNTATNIQNALNAASSAVSGANTNLSGIGGMVIVTPPTKGKKGGFGNTYTVTFQNNLAGVNVQQLVANPSPAPPTTPRIDVSTSRDGGSGAVVNGTGGGPGVWRYTSAGAGNWFNLTNVVSTNRRSTASTNTVAPTPNPNPPKTPGPDDNYNLSFPQASVTWSDIAIIRTDITNQGAGGGPPVLYAALGAGSGNSNNGIYWTENPTSNNPVWYVGDPGGLFANPATQPTTVDNRPANSGSLPGAGSIKLSIPGQNSGGVATGGSLVTTTVNASVGSPGGGQLGFYRTTTGGQSWAAVAIGATYLNGLSSYANAILAANGVVYVGGSESSVVTHANNVGSISGTTFTDLSNAGGSGPHTNVHAFTFVGGNLYAATDGGLFRYNGASWTDLNGNLTITQINSIAAAPNSLTTIFAGSQSNGIDKFSNSLAWTAVDGLGGGTVLVDPNNPNNVFAIEFQPVGSAKIIKSTNGGTSWNPISGALSNLLPNPPLVLSANDPNRLLVGGTLPLLYESLDGGASWSSSLSGALSGISKVTAIGLAGFQGTFQLDSTDFPLVGDIGANTYDSNTIYVTDGTKIYVTKNHGVTWVDRSTGTAIENLGSITQLLVDPRNRDTVYAVRSTLGDQKIFKSTDAGVTWVGITGDGSATGDLPNVPVWTMVLDPRNDNIYVGTDAGVYELPAGTTTWHRIGANLPNVQVHSLELSQTTNTLLAGTYGRGVFRLFLNDSTANGGALREVSGSSTWTGSVIFNNDTTIRVDGTQLISSGVSAASLTLSGVVSDIKAGLNYTFNKTGQGTLVLNQANTYGGKTNVLQGVLSIKNAGALGGTALGTEVFTGAALQLESNLGNEPVTLHGDGPAFNDHNTGSLHNVSGANTYTGPLTLASDATIGVDSGQSLAITNVIGDGGGGYNLTKELTGTLVLSGSNTYGGVTSVDQGVLQITNSLALGGSTGGTVVRDGAQLQLANNITVVGEHLSLSGGGINHTGALLNLSDANLWQGGVTFTDLPGFAPATTPPNDVTIGANAASTLTIDGVVDQNLHSFGLDKVGGGRVILKRDSTYSGLTTVEAGQLQGQSNGAFGTVPAPTPFTTSANYTGLGAANGAPPPDANGAAGPTNYVETVNGSVAIYTPKATGASSVIDTLDDFFYTKGAIPHASFGSSLARPGVVFDELINRFIVGVLDIDPASHLSNFLIAVSTTATPTTLTAADWNFYAIPVATLSQEIGFDANFPGNYGYNSDAFVLTLNMFGGSTLDHVLVTSVKAADLANHTANAITAASESGGVATITVANPIAGLRAGQSVTIQGVSPGGFNGTFLVTGVSGNTFTYATTPGIGTGTVGVNSQAFWAAAYQNDVAASNLRPTTMHGSIPGDPMWLLTEGGNNQSLKVYRMTNVLSNSAAFNVYRVGVNSYAQAVAPSDPGGSLVGTAGIVDSRILKAAESNNVLVAAHTVSVSATEDAVRWYAIDVSTGTPLIADQGDVSFGNNTYSFDPAIDINARDDIGLTFMRSATGTVTTRTLSAYITGRSPLDAAGSMQTPVRIQAGAANYGDSSTGGPNVGQISGIALDPTDGSFWAVTEYATGAANNNWATRIANFSVAVSATDPGVLVNNGATLELSGAKTATITNATAAGTTVTITASAPVTGLAAGQKVTISGILTPGYNGTFTVATVSGNQFTYVAPVAPGGSPAVLGATPKATYGINVAEVLTLNGTGVGGNGSLVNLLGDNRWTSAVTLPTAVNINVAANSSLTITGVVKDPVPVPSTPATVDKTGQGLLALTNTNTYTGQTNVDVGTVEVDGPNGVIGVVSLNGGTLGGTGTVGTVTTATSGTVNPGLVATPGTLKSSSETWNATTNFFVDLNSTASYDKLNVTGNVDLNNTFLTGSAGPALNIGDTFDILTYTGALSGQFTGVAPGGTVQLIADGGTVFIAGQKFTLNYVTASKLVRLTRQVTNVVFISQAVQSVAAPFGSTSAYGVDIAFTVTFQSEAGTLNSGVVDFTFNGHTVTKTITNNKAVALLSDFLLDFPLDASASAYTMDWAFNGGNGFTPIDANNPGAVGTAGSLGNTGNPAHMTFNVTVATPTVNVTGPSTALYGETKKFTATVVPPGSGTPTGSVLFVFHSTGNPDISFNGVGQGGGVWTVDIGLASGNVLTPRTYTVEAQYTSDHTTTRFVSQNGSKAGTFVVSQANASFTSFTAAPSSPQNYGTQVTFSVQVDPGTGSVGDILGQKVIFNDNGVPLNGTGTALVSDGFGHAVASYQTGATQLSANFGASHVITATLAPNGNYAGSNATLSGGYTVNQITPAVFTLSLSEPSISQGRNEIATATITNPVGAPTGTVTFYIDAVGAGNSLGTGTYDSLTQTWTRSFSTAGLSGAHTVFAVYGGDANFIGGGQQSTGMTVNPNFPPSFTGPMPDLSFSHTTASVNVNLTGVDPNGDPLTYTVTYVKYNDLVNLNNTYHFFTDPNASPADPYHQNNLSGNDPFYNGTRWIYSNFNGANAYYLKTDGSLYRWGGKTTSNAHTFDTLITKLPFFVYDDPSLLFNPLTPVDPAPVQKSVSGNVLTIDPPAVFRGIFQVQVSVSDGVVTVGPQLFNVYVSDNPPSLDPVGDQQLVHTAGSINVALSPHDVDSDPISYNVTLSQYTVLTSLNATYHFFTDPNASPADPYHQNNLAGNDAFYNGTRWFYSNFGGSTGAYYLKTDGSLYRWGGSTAGNAHTFDTLITKVPAFVYTDPMLLINAQTQPNPNAGGVTTSVSGNVLTINSPVSYSGIFLVQVQATDGMVPAPAQSFAVYATNTPTTLAAINDVQFSHSLPSYDVTLSSTDPDPGENITYNVTLSKYTDLTSLNATYHFFKDPNASPADPYHQDNLSGNDPAYVGTRWIYSGASAYYLRTDGSLYRWGGKTTSNAHTFDTLITKLPFFVYNDPSLLWNAQAQVDPNTVPIVKSVSGNTLTLDPPASYAGIFQVSVTASDSASTTAPRTFAVYVSNSPPSLAPLSDITYVHSAGGAIVGLSSSDADGDAITYNVVLSQYTALTSLNNTYHFYTDPNASPADPYHQNNLAANDPFYTNTRWFYSNFNGFHAYYLKNDGNLYRWGGSTAGNAHTFDSLVTKLPAFVYTDPTLLINAQTQADPNAAGVTKSVSGNTLTLLSPTSYTGIYQVTVSAGDGVTSSTPQTFAVYSSNNAPTLAPLNDLSFSHTTPSVNVNLSSSDADGDTITYNVTYSSYNGLVQAQQTYQFYTDPNASPADPYHQNNLASIDAFYTNTRWIYSNTGGFHAYYLKNDGSLYRWGGSTSSNAHLSDTLVTKFGFFVYDDPTLLLKPGTPPNPSVVGKTVTGNTLTIDPPNLFTGVFQVTVAASDGAASSTRTFLVYVSDNAPTIAPIPNQTMTHASQPLVVNLSVADADGDAVTIIATPNSTQNPLKLLDDQYQFSQDFSDYRLNFYGYQEKWLLSNANGNHYAIVPPGKVVHGSTLTDYHLFAITNNPADPFGADIGAVSADVYNNPSLLWNAQSGSVSIVQTGSQLSFTVTSNFYGTFTVTVSASDGMLTTTRSFTVTVN